MPKTVHNFAMLCTGEMGNGNKWLPLHYKDLTIYKAKKHNYIISGDVTLKDGRGGDSIYGYTFDDENFDLSFD